MLPRRIWPTLLFLVVGLLVAQQAMGQGAVQPTGPGELPPAIIGTAPVPSGLAVAYLADDNSTSGYLAVPEGAGPFPAVILIHEWNGLSDNIRQVADQLAAEGYVAFAVDLYHGRVGTTRDENMALMGEARGNEPAMVANIDTATRWLRARPDVTGKIAVMGWCFGGGVAPSYGLEGEQHQGTAIFYGRLVEDPEVLRALTHPVYGTFAANDRGIPPDQVERFAAALSSIGIENDIHVYDHVGHGFWLHVDRDPDNSEAPALDAWQRLKTYLAKVLS